MSELEAARIILAQARDDRVEAQKVTIRASSREQDCIRAFEIAFHEWEKLQRESDKLRLSLVLNYEI